MPTDFIETLHSWQNFYFMAGSASAGLLGLMFVALSLGMHLVSRTTPAQFEAFATPSVLYLVAVLLIAGVMLVPAFAPPVLGAVLLLGGTLGLARTSRHVRHLIRTAIEYQDFTVMDWLAQIIFPVVSHLLMMVSGLCFLIDQSPLAFASLWLATILLLIAAIANTWSLVIWIIEQPPP